MTREEREQAIAILENEKKCVNRANKNDYCNRDCYNCELVKTDTEILMALDMAIEALQAQAETKCNPNDCPHPYGTYETCNACKTSGEFKMRDATPEEQEAIDKYIKSISKPTGINIFDFYEDGEQEELDFIQPKKTMPCTVKIREQSKTYKGMTNGEVIKTVFPNIPRTLEWHIQNVTDEDWWNSPYSPQESEDENE